MKNAARYLFVSSLAGALSVVASCSGGSAGGGAMYVQSCSLGCTNGSDGSQVSCGIVNTYQNQDVAVVFSRPVDPTSLLANSAFQVVDTVTGAVPPGSRKIDPTNSRRALFRPKLTIDASGNPSFGFSSTSSYQIRIPGTEQGDNGPFVKSDSGQANRSRLLCTITTNQGLIDPVPGSPSVSVFVDAVGITQPINLDTLQAVDPNTGVPLANQPPLTTHQLGAVTVLKNARRGYDANPDPDLDNDPDLNPVVIEFNDIMNIGTLLIPASGQAPFISVKVDPDGDVVNTPNDAVAIGGTYRYSVDQDRLTTTLKFFPSAGYPSAGADPNAPRVVIVDIPTTVKDLAGHSVSNIGKRLFIPEVIGASGLVLPQGGEQFNSTANMDPKRTGAYWGEETSGLLTAGHGGGSGRLGDLVLTNGQQRTVSTSLPKAIARIKFLRNPKPIDAAAVMFGDSSLSAPGNTTAYYEMKKTPTLATHVQIDDFTSDTVSEFVRYFEVNALNDPIIAGLDFYAESADTIVVTAANPGTVGNTFYMATFPIDVISIVGDTSEATVDPSDTNWLSTSIPYFREALSGGADSSLGSNASTTALLNSLDRRNFITNLDFPSPQVPLVSAIPDPDLTGGVFEFSYVDFDSNVTLSVSGDNPFQLLARGQLDMADTATISATGGDLAGHSSDLPFGQKGAFGGPGAGAGGQGGDRPDNTAAPLLLALPNCTQTSCGGSATNPLINHGITNVDTVAVPVQIDGRPGQGVGGALGFGNVTDLGTGLGGVHWPANFPSETNVKNDLDVQTTNCESQQIGASGSGGAFSVDGTSGVARSSALLGINNTSNTPADTLGGDSATVGLEPASAPGDRRKLTPSLGYLRGGAGGGGGGSSIFGTRTNGGASCLSVTATINWYRSHSGAGGGGGGGAVQVVAGRSASIDGRIDVSGGDGGDALATAVPYGQHAAPGGGGSGGAVLLQSRTIDLSPLANRLIVTGGFGGFGPSFTSGNGAGGNGGTGLVRIEGDAGVTQASAAASVNPAGGPNNSEDWLSVDVWADQSVGAEAMSGAQSCWLTSAEPGFFALVLDEDAGPNPTDAKGWDMDIALDLDSNPGTPATVVSYRTSTVFAGATPEQHWGNLIDDGSLVPPQAGAPIIIRFQGAKSVGLLSASELCDLDVNDTQKVAFGSLTPWVMHPEQLNRATTRPDLVRYQIIFDRAHPDFAMIEGVTNIRIHVTPD